LYNSGYICVLMTRAELTAQIFSKRSYLCTGLDPDLQKIPKHLLAEADPLFEFCKAIIDATKDHCVAYKINTAFFESSGSKGWASLERTVQYIPAGHFKIADAKRGDIGNSSTQYAKAFFETMNFDAVTVSPYMGEDSVRPFLEFKGKWAIVLGLTSNPGAKDFEMSPSGDHKLYEQVLKKVASWGNKENLMFVIGATQANEFTNVRKIAPGNFYLVPGIGVQGGSLKEVSEKAMIKDCGILVNISREIIYASGKEDFAEMAASVTQKYQAEMAAFLVQS